MARSNDIDILLLGKTGAGKSALGNSILRRQAFESGCNTSSITTAVAKESSTFEGRTLTVVDTPGIGDTRVDTPEDEVKRAVNSVEDVMTINPAGYDVFLFVMRFGSRFTKEDEDSVGFLRQVFGHDFLRRYCIVVCSCGDNFQVESQQTGISFEQWVGQQTGAFSDLVKECMHRVVLFDNMTRDSAVKDAQVKNLVNVVDRVIQSQANRYMDLNFRLAGPNRQRLLVAAEGRRISTDIMNKVIPLSDGLREALANNPEEKIDTFRSLLGRSEELMEQVRQQDKGTGALKFIIDMIEPTRMSLSEALKTQIKVKENKERMRQQQDEMWREAREKMRREQEEMMRSAEQARLEEDRRRAEERRLQDQRREEDERKSRERMEELERQLERERSARESQEEELKRPREERPRSRSPPIERKVVREVNRVVSQIGRVFRW